MTGKQFGVVATLDVQADYCWAPCRHGSRRFEKLPLLALIVEPILQCRSPGAPCGRMLKI
ncbi:MAG: hypothetical protein ACYSUX_14305 [Planctomycetota bacterium]